MKAPLGASRRPQEPRKRKVRVQTYASLRDRLDDVFSVWTRLRFTDDNGIVSCVSCGVRKHWKDRMDAGHFVPRGHLATRWHPENVAPQCKTCNWKQKFGNSAPYAAWGVNWYGMDWPARMVALSRTETKLTRADLQSMIEDYEGKIKAL